jgi:CRP-like cAMP-binding protein
MSLLTSRYFVVYWVVLFGLGMSDFIPSDYLLNCPLLNAVSKETKDILLQDAQQFVLEDKRHLVEQGDIRRHVYFLANGKIRLFSGNELGQEIIFGIASHETPLLLAATISGSYYRMTMQPFHGPCVIYRFSSELVETLAMRDSGLSRQLLILSDYMNQLLVAHIEQLTLRSAHQRVGWYLLRLLLEAKRDNSSSKADVSSLVFPVDKSMIATYLGMTPETFSRSLQQLKIYGVSVDKQHITLTDPDALCRFCSIDVMAQCHKAEANECSGCHASG